MKYVEEPVSDEVHRQGNQGPIKEAFSLAPENVKDEGQTCISALVEVVHGGGAVSYTHLTLPTNREV